METQMNHEINTLDDLDINQPNLFSSFPKMIPPVRKQLNYCLTHSCQKFFFQCLLKPGRSVAPMTLKTLDTFFIHFTFEKGLSHLVTEMRFESEMHSFMHSFIHVKTPEHL